MNSIVQNLNYLGFAPTGTWMLWRYGKNCFGLEMKFCPKNLSCKNSKIGKVTFKGHLWPLFGI